MTHTPTPRIYAITLATTVSTLVMLSACTTYHDWKQGITGERDPQVVDGPRRVPEYNPQVQMLPPDAPEQLPVFDQKTPSPPPVRGGYNNTPMVTTQPPAPPVANPANNPYDNYDENGNPIGPKTAAQPNPPPSSQNNFFNRVFSSAPPPPPAAAQPANTLVPLLGDDHKPIPGNPHYSDETTGIAPLPPGPESTAPVVPQDAAPAAMPSQPTSQLTAPPAETQIVSEEPAEKTVDNTASNTGEKKSSWFSRTFKVLKSPFESHTPPSQDDVEKMDAAQDSGTSAPKLSSVPPTPDEFKAVKAGKQDQMEDLALEHMQAEQDKASLDNEPSQFDVNKPVEPVVDAAKSVPPVNVQPTQKTVSLTSPPTQTPGNGPVLLGHVSDNQAPPPAETTALTPPVMQPQSIAQPQPAEFKTQPFAPVEQAKETPLPAPTEQAQENAAQPQENADRHPYWWEGWNMFGKKKEQAAAEEPANAPVAAQEQMQTPPVAAQAPAVQPAPSQMATTPAPQNTALPDLTPSAPSVAEDTSDEAPAAAPANTASAAPSTGLPSPEILQQVKMLPPSRYTLRNEAYQHPLDEQ